MLPDPRERPAYIGSEIYRGSTYGPAHPLAIPRVSTCTDLVRAMGWLDARQYADAPMATDAEITRFHDPAYLAALKRAEARQAVSPEDRERFRIGADGNPVYREVYRRPATSAGGTMLAARLTAQGGVVHCPGGGTHHGRRDRASGFCYLNDPVLAMLDLAGSRAGQCRLSRPRRASRRWRAGCVRGRSAGADHQHPRGRALAGHRRWRTTAPAARRAISRCRAG